MVEGGRAQDMPGEGEEDPGAKGEEEGGCMRECGGLRSGEEVAKESPWPLSRDSCMEGAAGEAVLDIVAASRS